MSRDRNLATVRQRRRGRMIIDETRLSPFGAWFLAEMKRRGWSGAETARRMGIYSGTISKWLYGDIPTPESCELIAEGFELPLDLVLDRAGHRRQYSTPSDEVRAEVEELLDRIPKELLVSLVPALRGMANPAESGRAAQMLRQVANEREDDEDEDDLEIDLEAHAIAS